MRTKTKKQSQERRVSDENKLDAAKADFNKLMEQIKPFITKSDVVLESTDGKWYDAIDAPTTDSSHNSFYS